MARTTDAKRYRESEGLTASPPRLIVMMYEGAVRFCRQALAAIRAADHGASHEALLRAQAILMELLAVLDRGRDPVFGDRLASLYVWLHRRLVEANVKKDAAAVEDAIGHLESLLGSWREAVRELGNGVPPAPLGASCGAPRDGERPRVEVSA